VEGNEGALVGGGVTGLVIFENEIDGMKTMCCATTVRGMKG
jgi:hypothetical protein